MNKWEDYFQILQVHVMAEPDMIKSAYLKLSKKYHPDVNASSLAQEKMSAINRAYEVLCNPVKRRQYLIRWIEKYSVMDDQVDISESPFEMDEAPIEVQVGSLQALMAYLQYLLQADHIQAYKCLSELDQKNITEAEFCHWQTLVAQVFELKNFQCIPVKQHEDIKLNQHVYEKMTEFHVQVTEQNHIMEREEEDLFSKCVVFEKGEWRIFLGHQQLNAIIQKFDELVYMKKSKKQRKDTIKVEELNKDAQFQAAEVLVSVAEFQKNVDKEQHRFVRYGNSFTLIKCEMRYPQSEMKMDTITQLIANKLRRLDNCCLWHPDQILILLPETNKDGAEQVVHKIIHEIDLLFGAQPLYYVVEEQRFQSLQELYDTIFCQ